MRRREGFIHDGARRCTLQLHVCTCKFRKRRYFMESIWVSKRTTVVGRTCRKLFARNPIGNSARALTAVRFSPVFVSAEVARPLLKRIAPIVNCFGFRVNRKCIRWNIRNIFYLSKPKRYRSAIQVIREICNKNLCLFFERKKVFLKFTLHLDVENRSCFACY